MENKIKLPVHATLGLIMANHTIKSKENSNIVFNEDLVYFQCLLNKNLMLKYGQKMQGTTFLVESAFSSREEKEDSVRGYKFSNFIKAPFLLQSGNNGLPPIDYVRKLYEYNARRKLSKVKNGELTDEILGQVDSKIALYDYASPEDYEKARYMYWCGDAILDEEYFRKTGKRRYLDTFENHAKEAYADGANAMCAVIAKSLGEDINNVYEVVKQTLMEFEALNFLETNTVDIKNMMYFEKLRRNSENTQLSEEERRKYAQELNDIMNRVGSYLGNNASEKGKE